MNTTERKLCKNIHASANRLKNSNKKKKITMQVKNLRDEEKVRGGSLSFARQTRKTKKYVSVTVCIDCCLDCGRPAPSVCLGDLLPPPFPSAHSFTPPTPTPLLPPPPAPTVRVLSLPSPWLWCFFHYPLRACAFLLVWVRASPPASASSLILPSSQLAYVLFVGQTMPLPCI